MFERLRSVPVSFWKSVVWKRIVWAIAGIAVVARLIPLLKRPQGDFELHYGLGKLLVDGKFLYYPGFDRVYPPLWAMAHAPFTFFKNWHGVMIALYPLGVAAIVGFVALLKKLADRQWPLSPDAIFWSSTLAILLAGPFLHRDLVELGVNTLLILLTWLGVYCWTHGKDWLGGIPIGLAAALKCTPIAFVAYFAWKREWKIALAGAVAAVLFTCLPATMMGWGKFVYTEHYWLREVIWKGVSDPDPSKTVLGPDRVGNLSLRTALARYLISLPYGDPGRPETPVDSLKPDKPPEPLYFDLFKLPPATAGRLVKIILLTIAAWTAWLFRHRAMNRDDPRILWECAALSIAILLYSPLTWAQHCPAVLPALYFMFRSIFSGQQLPRFVPGVLIAFFVIICVLQRGVLQGRLSGLLDAYHLRNFVLLALFWATVRCRNIPGTAVGDHQLTAGAQIAV